VKNSKEEALRLFGATLGGHIHSIKVIPMDKDAKSKDDAFQVKVPFQSYVVDHVKVNTVAHKQVSGGIDIVLINGGEKEIKIGLNEPLINNASEIVNGSDVIEKRTFFGDATTPAEIVKAMNLSEVARIDTIMEELAATREALIGIVEATDRAAKSYDGLD
jgi:hypothetical protein